MRFCKFGKWALAVALLVTSAPLVQGAAVYGVTARNELIFFTHTTPGNVTNVGAITGLGVAEQILAIDFRPATGQLYGLGSENRLYTINTATGAATQVGSDGAFALNGSSFGFDFNPTVDRIRLVSDSDQNLRLNPITGGLGATDANLNPASDVVGSAYTNNFAGATTTTLYGIDYVTNNLVRQGGIDGPPSPNLGNISVVGALGFDVDSRVGFDIGNGLTLASLNLVGGSTTGLFTIDLSNGSASFVGNIEAGSEVTSLAINPVPEPSTYVLFGTGLAAAIAMRRYRRS